MKAKAQKVIQSIDFYFKSEPCVYYVQDLVHNGPILIKEAKAKGIKVYGALGRRGKCNWIAVKACGSSRIPYINWIKFSNGVVIYDYDKFDDKKDCEQWEMDAIIAELGRVCKENWPSSGNRLISNYVEGFAENQRNLYPIEDEHYIMLKKAMRGGANAVMPKFLKVNVPTELHMDFHQMYASIMKTKDFPCGEPIYVEGYYAAKFALYMIAPHQFAKLKEFGYPVIPIGGDETGMAGTDGQPFDVGNDLQVLTSIDIDLLVKNYDLALDEFDIVGTLYYPESINGEQLFGNIIDLLYAKRKEFIGTPEARLYKKLNEILPGHFEMTEYSSGYWKTGFIEPDISEKTTRYNPKIGIFITAYGREKLYNLLNKFEYSTVIGFDTDCVFFNNSYDKLPYRVCDMVGSEMGQLHPDGWYSDVIHVGSKRYYGYQYGTKEPFKKMAGGDGRAFVWDPKTQLFTLKNLNKGEQNDQGQITFHLG